MVLISSAPRLGVGCQRGGWFPFRASLPPAGPGPVLESARRLTVALTGPLPGNRHREDPRPAFCRQALQPAVVLVRAEGAGPGESDVASAGFDPDGSGGERDPVPVAVAALLGEPGEPGPFPARFPAREACQFQ